MEAIGEQAALLQREWQTSHRWAGITRDFSALDVIRLRGRVAGEHGPARRGAGRLWELLHHRGGAPTLGAFAGHHAAQAAGVDAIYLPGWQGDDETRMPGLVRGVNRALAEAAPAGSETAGGVGPERRLPAIVADAGGSSDAVLDAFGLTTEMIGAGAAAVCFEDLTSTDRADGRAGEQALVPTRHHIGTLNAARLAADVLGVPSLIIARTGAHTASLLTSAIDPRDHEFLTGERTADGLHRVEPGWYACVTRQLAYAPYADLLWLETPAPDLDLARAFACIIHSQYPDKPLAYSYRAPVAGPARASGASAAEFQRELAAMGYRFQATPPIGHSAPSAGLAGQPAYDDAPAYA
jgi:isocitrate lyase